MLIKASFLQSLEWHDQAVCAMVGVEITPLPGPSPNSVEGELVGGMAAEGRVKFRRLEG
jgi:hypothetical protein